MKYSQSSKSLWLPLEKGDRVDVIAPGFRATDEELAGGIEFLRSWHLEPRVPKKLFGRDVISSNTDDARFEHLRAALYAPDSQAIWCVRGGYGSVRLLPRLAKLRPPKGRPKLFIGLSDITSLHIFLNQEWGWPTVHGPLLDRLGRKAALPKYEKEMKRFVFGGEPEIRFKGLMALNEAARRPGIVRGPLVGGNLVVTGGSLGTPFQVKTEGRILFLEDLGERGYRIDRVLEQFTQAGLFKRARAVVFGQIIGGKEADGSSRVWPVIHRFAEASRIPVVKGLASGHDVIQRPVPFATRAELRLSAKGRAELICESGCAR